jgi:hypothetical protein
MFRAQNRVMIPCMQADQRRSRCVLHKSDWDLGFEGSSTCALARKQNCYPIHDLPYQEPTCQTSVTLEYSIAL